MRLLPDDPPRISERRDQPNLAERIAGQAFRDLPPPEQLSYAALDRIAANVDAHGAPDRRRVPARDRYRGFGRAPGSGARLALSTGATRAGVDYAAASLA